MCIRDRGDYAEIRFRIRLWKISRDVARESSSFYPESRREGKEVSLREIFREKPDWEGHFSAALDKGDHMAAHGKKFAPSVQNPTLEKSRALLPEKSLLPTLILGGKERKFRC